MAQNNKKLSLSENQIDLEKSFVSGFLKRSYSSNVLFWLIYIFIVLISSIHVVRQGEITQFVFRHVLEVVFLLIAIVINNRILVPNFLEKKKGIMYTLLLVFTIFFVAGMQYFLTHFLVNHGFDVLTPLEERMRRGALMFNAVPMLFFVMLNLFLKIFKEWANLQEVEKKLQEAKKEALKIQLENLKAQVNPHFLFNTLNNIYSLSLFNDSRTPETILKLSNLLSYMIYDCRGDKVKIDKEMEFIENYTTLEKLRFNENASLELSIAKNWNGDEIAPLLFTPFIENAFKHGMNIHSREPKISIKIENLNNEHLHFICKNFTDNIKNPGPGGIGLENVKSRLGLLYPDRYDLNITNIDNCFTIDLRIDISRGPELTEEMEKVEA